jgi:phosphate-selective porin
MPVKKNYRLSCLVFFILLLPFAPRIAVGQNTAVLDSKQTSPEIERLNRQIEDQKAELQKLREELKAESEQRRQQQKLLESLAQKLDKLDTSLAEAAKTKNEKPAEIIPAVLEKQPSSQTTAAVNQEQKSTDAKQSDKPQAGNTQNAVETGLGKVKFTGLIQGWYAGGNRGFNDTFRIRRAELKFTGDLLPKVKWTVMLDLAKALSLNTASTTVNGTPVIRDVSVNQSSRILQEAFVTLGYFKRANINIGQFKLPVSQEALQSSGALDTVERALFLTDRSRGGALGDVRDFGVMAFGGLNKQIDYQIGVFNGSGENMNDVDRSDQKAIAGRLVFRPEFIKGLQIGGSGVWGNGDRLNNPRRDRLGAEMVYVRDKFKVKSEFMTGVDGEIHRRGYYAHFGYRFIPKLEGIFRFDMFDPDIRRESSSNTVTERDFITGINYYINDNNLKLQVNYLRKTFAGSFTPSRNQLLVNLQTSW